MFRTLYWWTLGMCWLLYGWELSALPPREANTSLRLPADPLEYDFEVVSAFNGVSFFRPLAVVTPPGETNRLFVVEQPGVIYVITNLVAPDKTVFLDLTDRVRAIDNEEGLLGLAFHPQYAVNGFFYVFYTVTTTTASGTDRHDRLSRFSVDPLNRNAGLPDSETPLISQFDDRSNHNGGDLHFGTDGFLYVSLGDEGSSGDARNNSRFINKDFFSAILRLDVDRKPASLEPHPHPAIHLDGAGQAHYAIPPDNPFIGAASHNGQTVDPSTVRTEIWATGLRNPWRFSFDPVTGLLYCGDVGQGAREEVNLIKAGGDYGWKYQEGTIAYGTGIPPGTVLASELTPPILDYPQVAGPSIPGGVAEGKSVTGGVVYRGNRFPQLAGVYVFGDYVSGRIFGLRYHQDTEQVTEFRQLASAIQPTAFGVDPANGDVLIVLRGGAISRLITTADPVGGEPPPALLSQTGAFSDLAALTPHPGVVPYSLNVPFWSDHALKSRWFSVPDTNQVISFSPAGNWLFPTGTVWIKHFELELTNGVPASRRRLETRFLVKNDDGIHGFTYKWNAAQTDADLVPEGGGDESLTIYQPTGDVLRQQVWRYPSRSECLQCHTPAGGFALGFNTAQLNRAHDYGAGAVNQLTALASVGYFAPPVPDPATLPVLVPAADQSASLEARARSYLDANCVACHQPGGTAQGLWDARFETALESAGIVNGPLVNNGGDPASRVIAPGDPPRSMILTRISQRGPGQMPPLGSTQLDAEGMALITAWIEALATSGEPQEPVITWNPPAAIVYGTALGPAQLNATADVPGAFTYDPPAGTVLAAGGGQTLRVSFIPEDPVAYTNAQATVAIDVNRAGLTITAENKAKTYGAANPALTAVYAGFVNGETAASLDTPVNLTTTAGAGSPAGSYPITAAGAVDANYTITHVNGTLTVNRAGLTITAENKAKIEGQPNPALTAAYVGFANGENAAALDSPVVLTTAATVASPVGTYPITASGAADPNYTITHVNGVLTVEANARLGTLELGVANRVTVRVSGHPNRAYRLQWSPNLELWTDLATVTTDATGAGLHVESNAPAPGNRYFRILWP